MGGHLAFLKGKWKEIEERKKMAIKYGDNLELIKRHQVTPKPNLGARKHSFSHLLNVHHPVRQVDWPRARKAHPDGY
jgi:hypothetical protein